MSIVPRQMRLTSSGPSFVVSMRIAWPVMRICVYAGSNPGREPGLRGGGRATLARLLARRGIGVVYGGGKVGLMGDRRRRGARRRRRGDRRDPAGPGRPRDRPPRADRAARRRLDARAQGADGRARGRVRRAARRRGHARGADRDLHVEPARPARQADGRAQRQRLLRRRSRRCSTTPCARGSCARRTARRCTSVADPAALLARFEGWKPPTVGKWLDRTEPAPRAYTPAVMFQSLSPSLRCLARRRRRRGAGARRRPGRSWPATRASTRPGRSP